MKSVLQSNYSKSDDLEQLSLTEKAVMGACNICLVLDASKVVPSTQGWSVSQIAVLLIDSQNDSCLLRFEHTTKGVWSIIEKDLAIPSIGAESALDTKHMNKRKRVSNEASEDEQDFNDAGFEQLAFSAVKEVTGINRSDLTVLESHDVYSLSKQKTAVRFYIVQCNKSIKHDDLVPIKDVLESLQGPLIIKNSRIWMLTPVVEYFHVLPYSELISNWYSRVRLPNSLQNTSVGIGNKDSSNVQGIEEEIIHVRNISGKASCVTNYSIKAGSSNNNSQLTEKPCAKEVNESRDCHYSHDDNADSSGNGKSTEIIPDDGCHTIGLSGSSHVPHTTYVNESFVVQPQNEEETRNILNAIKVYHHQEKISTDSDRSIPATSEEPKAEINDPTGKLCINECRGENGNIRNQISSTMSPDQDGIPTNLAPITFWPNGKCLEKVQNILATKDNELAQASLRVLHRKRQKLSFELRNMEDEIAICDKKIQTILEGGEDGWSLKLEAVVDFCNDLCLKGKSETEDGISETPKDQGIPDCLKRKRLSEATLTLHTKLQDLDEICNKNHWILPRYQMSVSDGEFLASVTVEGLDFECTVQGNLCSNPREARESAAAHMIAKLQSMIGSTQ